jgi:hypothetical protein
VGRDGLILLTNGIDLSGFRANPAVLFSHGATKPVGRCTSITAVGTELIARIAFAPAGTSATATVEISRYNLRLQPAITQRATRRVSKSSAWMAGFTDATRQSSFQRLLRRLCARSG